MFSLEYLRSFKVFQFAIFDLVLSYLGIFLLSPLLIGLFKKINIKTNRAWWLWMTLPISIGSHLLVDQQTPLTKMFFDLHDFYLIKVMIVGMVLAAFLSRRD